jgi:hypothetical protein
MSDIRTFNLSEADDGMVSIDKPSTSFVAETDKNNVSEYKATMDSTPIDDIMADGQEQGDMMDPRMMDPRAGGQPAPQQAAASAPQKSAQAKKANPMNLTDEQMQALLVAACTAISISKPIQEKLAGTIPQFLNAQGSRSMVGLASTGVIAAAIFYIASKYV